MKLKNGRDAQEALAEVHPDLRLLLNDFDVWSKYDGLPEPTLTEVIRTLQEQEDIYFRRSKDLLKSLEPGPRQHMIDPEGDGTWRPTTPSEQVEAHGFVGKSDAELRAIARKRFTWHIARCAVDIRTRNYTRSDVARVWDWFQRRCKRPDWELVKHDTKGPHIHVGRRATDWKAKHYDSLMLASAMK